MTVGCGRVLGAPDVHGGYVAYVDVGCLADLGRELLGRGSGGEDFPERLEGHVEVGGIGGRLDWGADYDAWVDGGDGEGCLWRLVVRFISRFRREFWIRKLYKCYTLCSSRNFQISLSASVFEAAYKAALFPSLAACGAHSFQSSSVTSRGPPPCICDGAEMAAIEEVRIKDWSCGPACLKADVRILRLPFIAGTTASDHSLKSRDIGEAVCRIMLTPGVYTYDDMALSDERGKMKERKGMVVFHLEEIYIIVEK